MKSSTSSLQIIVLILVLSGMLLFSIASSSYNVYHIQIADAKKVQHGSKATTPYSTSNTTNSDASSQTQQQQQQQPSIPDTIELSAKELPSGYKWINSTNGIINPTMNITVGNSKVIHIQNPTDSKHQLVIDDPKGNQLATSGDIVSGSSSQFSFKPGITGIFEYHCIYHPTTMKGIIQVAATS